MWEMIRGYLTFTRKERFGVLFLLIVISVLFVLPYLIRPAIGKADPAATEKMKEGIQKFESHENDSSDNASIENRNAKSTTPLFYFDPNNLSTAGWHKLGLSDHLIQTIFNYTSKGGRFEQPEDLRKLYGLHHSDYERLFPFVRIAKSHIHLDRVPEHLSKPSFSFPVNSKTDSTSAVYGRFFSYPKKIYASTDINQADSERWSQFPGIGARLASRIVHYRESLGGFYNVEQVAETFGLPDSTFQKIKPYLLLGAFSLHHIDLNGAVKEELQRHPYIRWQMANGIIEYRIQHGGFHSVDELMQLALVDSGKFLRLKPYLEIIMDQNRQ